MSKIVNLGDVRDLRQEWDKVRTAITAGKVKSFYLQVVCRDGREAVFMGGGYKTRPDAVARAALRISMARMRAEDDPLVVEDLDFESTKH